MKTTLELFAGEELCASGKAFAEAHPNPRKAIAAALAAPEQPWGDAEQWHFVRWACTVFCPGKWEKAGKVAEGQRHEHAKRCGDYLLAWLDEHGY